MPNSNPAQSGADELAGIRESQRHSEFQGPTGRFRGSWSLFFSSMLLPQALSLESSLSICLSVCFSLPCIYTNAHTLIFLSMGFRTCQSQPLIPLLPRHPLRSLLSEGGNVIPGSLTKHCLFVTSTVWSSQGLLSGWVPHLHPACLKCCMLPVSCFVLELKRIQPGSIIYGEGQCSTGRKVGDPSTPFPNPNPRRQESSGIPSAVCKLKS